MRPIPFNVIAKLLGLQHPAQVLIQGAAIDSRNVKLGDLFFALPGKKNDGHFFLKEAAERGAGAAVVLDLYSDESYGLPLLRVPNVLQALQDLARKLFSKRSSSVVAITGSLGKTMTKDFTAALLGVQYRIFSSPLSYNSQSTMPLNILNAEGTEDILILEMGMSERNEIEKLVSIAPPDIAVLTTVSLQHVSNFSDGIFGISQEKAGIFSHSKTRLGILHRDVDFYDEIYKIGNCPKKNFSLTCRESDYFLEVTSEGVRIHSRVEDPVDIPLFLPVRQLYQNFLAAYAVARAYEVPVHYIAEIAPTLKLPPMRFEKVEKQGIVFINDAYNANPDSMKAALESLPKPKKGGKRIAVLSEMDALGMYTEAGHAMVAEVALLYVDILLCIGEGCQTMKKIWKREKRPFEYFETRESLEQYLKSIVKDGDVVLLKGARSYGLDQILKGFE
jgi:UDP-N-acetylmuramoyl-tripeptide--D-alanyl-D-alanine ligase